MENKEMVVQALQSIIQDLMKVPMKGKEGHGASLEVTVEKPMGEHEHEGMTENPAEEAMEEKLLSGKGDEDSDSFSPELLKKLGKR